MSYYLVVGGERWTQVASIGGWKDYRKAVESLDADEFGQVRHLVEHGWSQKLPELERQLAAVSSKDPDVESINRALLDAVKARAPSAASAVLTDGLTSKDDADGSWQTGEED